MRGVINEVLFAGDLALISVTIKDLRKKFWNCKKALESKDLKVKIRKTKVVVS